MHDVVIVGASVAGLRAAETLRAEGFDGSITLIDADPHPLHDRPPLSKRILLGTQSPDQILLRDPATLGDSNLVLRSSTRAVALDVAGHRITVESGGISEQLACDGMVIATGASARMVPAWAHLDGVVTLRNLGDSLDLKARLEAGPRRVLVVGAGFIGLEVAASARQLGLEVTVVEPLAAPVVRGLGEQLGMVLADLHRENGVDLRLGTGVTDMLEADGRPGSVGGARLTDGSIVEADVVLVGIGAAPATGWLEGSGLTLRDGVVCDETMAAAPGIYAAGDVARWPHPLLGEEVRIEHWTNAGEQAMVAAKNLLAWSKGEPRTPYAEIPFFWSDQFGTRVQSLGRTGNSDRVEIVRGTTEERKFIALYGLEGRLVGAVGFALPRFLMPYRALLQRGATFDDALAFAATQ